MTIWGGLAKREDGGRVLQIYVDEEDVRQLLDRAGDRHYNQYAGDDMELDVPVEGPPIAEVWLCIVPDDPDWPR